MKSALTQVSRGALGILTTICLLLLSSSVAFAQGEAPAHHGGEADLVVPSLSDPAVASFFGMSGSTLLTMGLGITALGLVMSISIYMQLKNAEVHSSMLKVSELIYATCKTYLVTQVKFIMILE
ncbi:MAG: sodium-translocating pyrophosphatase, partial [Polyangiaceae bacterium]